VGDARERSRRERRRGEDDRPAGNSGVDAYAETERREQDDEPLRGARESCLRRLRKEWGAGHERSGEEPLERAVFELAHRCRASQAP
jgi:hypothetical protein